MVQLVLHDLCVVIPNPPLLLCNNQSAIALSMNLIHHSQIKHLEIDFHFVREWVKKWDMEVQYVPTQDQIVDILTKGLHSPNFVKHCNNLNMGNPN